MRANHSVERDRLQAANKANKGTANKGTEGIKSITEVIQRHEVHVGSRLIASVPLIGGKHGKCE